MIPSENTFKMMLPVCSLIGFRSPQRQLVCISSYTQQRNIQVFLQPTGWTYRLKLPVDMPVQSEPVK